MRFRATTLKRCVVVTACVALLVYVLNQQLIELPRGSPSILATNTRPPDPAEATSLRDTGEPKEGGMEAPTVAIIGSGLAGLSAALESSRYAAAAAGAPLRIVLLEKNGNAGGNSAKASSGINAINIDAGDSAELFTNDTLKSGGSLSKVDLVARLVGSSREAIMFLEACGVNLSKVVRLGGHSAPRTRSNPAGPNVGFALIKAISTKVKELPNVEFIYHAKVTKLGRTGDNKFQVSYSTQGGDGGAAPEHELLADTVVLATGGFAANKELLKRFAPETADLPTTNGGWATGDGLALGEALGAHPIQLDQVQVHPTGFVDPADPEALTKWLAPEKLRGCGAILLNPESKRFVDELSTRDKVSAAINQVPGKKPWLMLGRQGADMFGEATLGFYGSKKMIIKFDTLEAAAEHMAVPLAQLQQEIESYASAAAGNTKDAFGKQHFPTAIQADLGPFWVAKITPVVHYTMGGLEINDKAQVLDKAGVPIAGLFAAGEVSGGLHGQNRLGGNSLAECAVFGRVAGQQAAALLLNHQGVGVKDKAVAVEAAL